MTSVDSRHGGPSYGGILVYKNKHRAAQYEASASQWPSTRQGAPEERGEAPEERGDVRWTLLSGSLPVPGRVQLKYAHPWQPGTGSKAGMQGNG